MRDVPWLRLSNILAKIVQRLSNFKKLIYSISYDRLDDGVAGWMWKKIATIWVKNYTDALPATGENAVAGGEHDLGISSL